MRAFSFAVSLILMIAAFVKCQDMNKNTSERNMVLRLVDNTRVSRCSPKEIKGTKNRIVPVWSLKGLYDYRAAAKFLSDESVEQQTENKQFVTRTIQTSAYTSEPTTESAATTQSKKHTTTAGTEIKYRFFFLATTRGTNNYYQRSPTKLRTVPHKKILPKTTQVTKTQDDKETISFDFLSQPDVLRTMFDESNRTNFKSIESIKKYNDTESFFPDDIKNLIDVKSPTQNNSSNFFTSTTTATKTTTPTKMTVMRTPGTFTRVKNKLKHFLDEDTIMAKRNNLPELMATETTSIWKRNKPAKRTPTTPDTDVFTAINNGHNPRQLSNKEYYSENMAQNLRDVMINYDISRGPEHMRNSLQRFGLVYVPVPLKFKARYNYLNHYSVNPRMQVMLSNYGYYLPGSLGVKRFGLYNHMAYNNIYINKPFGATYRTMIDPDSET